MAMIWTAACRGSRTPPLPVALPLPELPTPLLQRIALMLDGPSRRELRKVDRRCRTAVDSCTHHLGVPLDALCRPSCAADTLSARFSGASYLELAPPERSVSLGVLERRRRCEAGLAVWLDNLVDPWQCLAAIDLSRALPAIGAGTLQLLVSALPGLQHLALPRITRGGWCGGPLNLGADGCAPLGEALRLLAQLPLLSSCQLDCGGGDGSGSSSRRRRSSSNLGSPRQSSCCGTNPVVVDSAGVPLLLPPQACAAGSDASSTSNKPWPTRLSWLGGLKQLQLLRPRSLHQLLPALAALTGLQGLGLTHLPGELASLLLCASGSGTAALGRLSALSQLTRLELGFDCDHRPSACGAPVCSTASHSGCHGPSRLLLPVAIESTSTTASAAAAAAASDGSHPVPPPLPQQQHTCAWSSLASLRLLVLSGVCLDTPLLLATGGCVRLQELRVGGLALSTLPPPGWGGLAGVTALAVLHRFDLGANAASLLFPRLTRLIIRDEGTLCPNLACLKAHPTLASLALEAAGGWSLGSLQLGHLLHADRLRHLSLASTFSGTISSTAAGVPAVVGKGATPCQAMRPPTMTQHCSTCRSAGVCGSGNAAGSAETAAGGLRLLLPHHRPGSAGSCATAVPGPSSKHGLPVGSLPQVTSLTLSGPVSDTALAQLPASFPGLVSLQLHRSYYTSDDGIRRLRGIPALAALLLDGCSHVTEFGLELLLKGGAALRVLAVHDCSAVDERACQRIRRACRSACACLHWHGADCSSRASANGGSSRSLLLEQLEEELHAVEQTLEDGVTALTASQHNASSGAPAATAGSANTSTATAGSANTATATAGSATTATAPHAPQLHAAAPICGCGSGSAFLERCWRESPAYAAQLAAEREALGLEPLGPASSAATKDYLVHGRPLHHPPGLQPGCRGATAAVPRRPAGACVAAHSSGGGGLALEQARSGPTPAH